MTITGESNEKGEQVQKIIETMIKDVEIGEEYDGKVVKILDGVGAIVEFAGKQSGMVHISKLADHRVEKVEDVVKKYDPIRVKVLQIDKERGRMGLQKIG